MTIAEPVRSGPLATLNPVSKLGAAMIVTAVLLVSIDPVSAGVALGLELVLLCFAAIPVRVLLVRTSPILIAAPLAGLTTVLYGRTSGSVHLHWWAIEVSDGSLQLGLATLLRVLAIGLPAVLLFVTIDPTDLADGLAQLLRLPARFVLGGLAGLRLVGLFVDDWRALTLARRARGVAESGALRRFLGQSFSLFVLSIRRGSKLATAMEARGFGASVARTWARPSVFRGRDWATLVVALAVAGTAAAVAIAVGSWNVLGS
ncbi:energy-coupling factor transporter transmembrane component T family protein [Leifsonia shinshuensis]|uniref:Energy-coupling factor transporter transmembrane protein EcfT n=1 Tax=Leifsonia shinshuensis TaxID=150026 RepID=A0A7G6Y7H5_9MICO|nr:energy-coupling factor transporter transmembrane component T [Leifsonia shinshuensis]QNE34440.1 energy-coupling factor transporter transmembrane protein EcfT [Leifsonia shinshuensis]